MSDKQSRYSHVKILESSDARVVVHWRYALSEVEHSIGAHPDPFPGWFDWADEYWTVYPDGVAVRKQVIRTTDVTKPHEWQESIILTGPGQRPEDNINWDALTLGTWRGKRLPTRGHLSHSGALSGLLVQRTWTSRRIPTSSG